MPTLIEQLERAIKQSEEKYGPDARSTKMWKEQLCACQETAGKTAYDVYRLRAVKFPAPDKN